MLWSTQSHAFSRWQNIPHFKFIIKAFKISFNNMNMALSLEEF
jgi:hypothetical protein